MSHADITISVSVNRGPPRISCFSPWHFHQRPSIVPLTHLEHYEYHSTISKNSQVIGQKHKQILNKELGTYMQLPKWHFCSSPSPVGSEPHTDMSLHTAYSHEGKTVAEDHRWIPPTPTSDLCHRCPVAVDPPRCLPLIRHLLSTAKD